MEYHSFSNFTGCELNKTKAQNLVKRMLKVLEPFFFWIYEVTVIAITSSSNLQTFLKAT